MMKQELTEFERAVLGKLLAGDHPVLEALRVQLRHCHVERREHTGHGFFTELEVDESAPTAPTPRAEARIRDVTATVAGLQHGAGFVLLVRDGYLDQLEGFSYEEPWPSTVRGFELAYLEKTRRIADLG